MPSAKAMQVQERLPMSGIANQKEVLRDIRNYLAGQAVGLTRDESLLDEVVKCALCRTWQAQNGEAVASDAAPEDVATSYRRTFKAILEMFPGLFENGAELLLGPQALFFINRAFAEIDFADSDRDLLGDIYEAFVGSAVRGQEGQFFTPRNAIKLLVSITNPRPGDVVIDPACGAGGFLFEAASAMKKHGELTESALHGVDKDAYLWRLARLHLAVGFGHNADIQCADSLAWEGDSFESSSTAKLLGKYSVVLTNPPFGSKIVATNEDTRKRFQFGHKWKLDSKNGRFTRTFELQNNPAPQVLFIEQCLNLVHEGGRIGMVIPESVLCNPSHRYVIQTLLESTTVVAVLGMPESLFKISGKGGTHTKVCLVVFEKRQPAQNHKIFMAEAKWCGHDSRGRAVPIDDLPEVEKRYGAFAAGELRTATNLGFAVPVKDIRNSILAPRYYDPAVLSSLQQLSDTHELFSVRDLVAKGHLAITTGDEPGKLSYGTGDVPFVRTSDISNWEIKIDPKHCVSEEYYRQVARKQDVREGDILMVRDGTYLIGTCAIVTQYDTRICYQSHLFKIRVAAGAPFDSYLLLALLSSEPVITQIRAMSFTQDIIDSLGDRIMDIVLPIPRSAGRRERVSSTVKKVIEDRIEARELARQARRLVVEADLPAADLSGH